MKSSLLWLATLALPALGGLTLRKRDNPAIVNLDIQRNHVSDPVARDRARRKRDKTVVSQALDNEETLYYCNVTLGTPEQSLRLVLDTGSSDLWCNAPNSTLCSSRADYCSSSGSYDSSASSTYSFVSSNFNITYADSSGATGDYVKDTLHIGGSTIQSFQFGVGYESSSAEGVLGVGYTTNEVAINDDGQTYANLPKAMVNKGLIKSNAYSLWLNDLDANTGSILFGGVNSAKYHGSLETLPIQKVNGVYSEFIIALTSVVLSQSSKTKNYTSSSLPAAVLLDSGSSLTYLPDEITQDIFNDLDVTYEESEGIGYVPCSIAEKNINISYTFSSPTIHVGINELVLDSGGMNYKNGEPACVFGIVPAGSSTAVLGDTFLRSAYVVYDLTNNEISLANTNFNSTDSDILEIGTGDDAVPGATAVANPVTTVAVGNSGARIGEPTGGTTLISPGSSTGIATTPRAMSPLTYLALGMAGAGVLLLL